MENNNRSWPHIRRVTHIMMVSHRSCFDFHTFNSKRSSLLAS
ncbi:leader peptide SpeFL [Shimwellia blattae]|nr:leader peptide SpeFL [Shimwellia blattae]